MVFHPKPGLSLVNFHSFCRFAVESSDFLKKNKGQAFHASSLCLSVQQVDLPERADLSESMWYFAQMGASLCLHASPSSQPAASLLEFTLSWYANAASSGRLQSWRLVTHR